MAYIKIRQGENIAYSVSSYVVDTKEDISKLPRSQMGSTAYVIQSKEKYICDSQSVWWPMASDGDPIKCECDCVDESTVWGELVDVE